MRKTISFEVWEAQSILKIKRHLWGILKIELQRRQMGKITKSAEELSKEHSNEVPEGYGSIKLTKQPDSGAATNLNCFCIGLSQAWSRAGLAAVFPPTCFPQDLQSFCCLNAPGPSYTQPWKQGLCTGYRDEGETQSQGIQEEEIPITWWRQSVELIFKEPLGKWRVLTIHSFWAKCKHV